MKNIPSPKIGLNNTPWLNTTSILLRRMQIQVRRLFQFLCLLVACCLVLACQRNTELDPLTVKIAEQVRMSENTKINLAALTDFDWDKVYFFSPKQTRDEVCATVKLNETDCAEKIEDRTIGEESQYLVFTKSEKVVRVLRHKRFFGDFNPPPKSAVSKARSEFKIYAMQSTSNGVPWYVLRQN